MIAVTPDDYSRGRRLSSVICQEHGASGERTGRGAGPPPGCRSLLLADQRRGVAARLGYTLTMLKRNG